MLSWNFIKLAQSTDRHFALIEHKRTLIQPSFLFKPQCYVVSGEAANTNFIAFRLTRSGIEPSIILCKIAASTHNRKQIWDPTRSQNYQLQNERHVLPIPHWHAKQHIWKRVWTLKPKEINIEFTFLICTQGVMSKTYY